MHSGDDGVEGTGAVYTHTFAYIHTYVQSFCCRRCKQLASVSSSSWRVLLQAFGGDALTCCMISCRWDTYTQPHQFMQNGLLLTLLLLLMMKTSLSTVDVWWLLFLWWCWWWIACGCVCVAIDVWIFWWVSHLVNGFTICMQVFSSFLHYERYSHTYFHSNMEISGSAHGVKICGIC